MKLFGSRFLRAKELYSQHRTIRPNYNQSAKEIKLLQFHNTKRDSITMFIFSQPRHKHLFSNTRTVKRSQLQ